MYYLNPDEDRSWMRRGNCAVGGAPTKTFFPERGQTSREAKEICEGCPVKAKCLDYALAHEESWGVWGGTSEKDRRMMRRKRLNERSLPLWEGEHEGFD